MCLIGIAYRANSRYPLLVAANRDEFHGRPTRPAGFWPDAPHLLAGRDLEAGGTWLGLTLGGRFAAITNYREPDARTSGKRSRGQLVLEFLNGGESAGDFCLRISRSGEDYGGFSLVVMDRDSMWFSSNRDGPSREVSPGVHGLSNRELDSPWPKVRRVQDALAAEVGRRRARPERLFAALMDRTRAPDRDLPDTGVGMERERLLSPAFIANPRYGTRCSTVIVLDRDGRVGFIEASFGESGKHLLTRQYRFRLGDHGSADDASPARADNDQAVGTQKW